MGAQSINPNIKVKLGWVTTSDFVKAFNDPVTGKSFAKQFLDQNGRRRPVPGGRQDRQRRARRRLRRRHLRCRGGRRPGLSYPDAAKCTVTSAEKKLRERRLRRSRSPAGPSRAARTSGTRSNDGVGVSPSTTSASVVPATRRAADTAFAAMKAGTAQDLPDKASATASTAAASVHDVASPNAVIVGRVGRFRPARSIPRPTRPLTAADQYRTVIRAPALEMRGITKRYPGVVANDHIDLTSVPARSTPCWARTGPARRPS